jgi:hypothetical protein
MQNKYNLKKEGALALTLGIIMTVLGTTIGTLSIIQGARLLSKSKRS